MIRIRHQQPSLWEGLFAEEVAELWEPWMRVVDELLEDNALVEAAYEAQGDRHEQSRTLGRPQTPAEVALRMLILKHMRNWSYETLERDTVFLEFSECAIARARQALSVDLYRGAVQTDDGTTVPADTL